MATGLLSKGITLSYKNASTFVELPDLMDIPDMGAAPEKVEVTTLSDGARRYIAGIKDYGDLEFTFLYDGGVGSSYTILRELEDSGALTQFQVEFPDATTFTFSATVATIIAGAKVNDALTFKAALTLNTDIVVA